MATKVPPELEASIQQAASKYGDPVDVLEGIWRVESGSTYPNPAVNSSGYGGLFGTKNWNAPTGQQADTAALILAENLVSHGGNLADALHAYSGGGYTSVPGETTFGKVLPNAGAVMTARGKEYGNWSGLSVSPGSGTAAGQAAGAVGGALGGAEGLILRGALMLGGILIALLGLYLVVKALGAPVPGPLDLVGGGVARKVGASGAASGAAGTPRRAGDAATARGEPVARTGQPAPLGNRDRRELRRNERARASTAAGERKARDEAFGADDDIPF
jgi:hypothetical protein